MKGEEIPVNQYEVRYKLFRRSRKTNVMKIKAEAEVKAAMAVALMLWKYPFRIVSVFEC
jgi:hypothetical protein